MKNPLFRATIIWAVITCVLCVIAYWHAGHSFRARLGESLQQQLPERLQLALQNRLTHRGPQPWIAEQLEQDLSSIEASGRLPLLQNCRALVVQLLDDGPAPEAGRSAPVSGEITIHWQFGDGDIQERARLSVDCGVNLPILVGSQGALALLLLGGFLLLPRPLTDRARIQVRSLMASGSGFRAARRLQAQLTRFNSVQCQLFEYLCQSSPLPPAEILQRLSQADVTALSHEQLSWFYCALSADNLPAEREPWLKAIDDALVAATAADRLLFDCHHFRVSIHGIPIALSKTPFFYYLWYARLRAQGEGWLLNPPVNRPDRENAESLIDLMEAHGGHAKSINDLRDNGLRAKTLDQNRNKIRDELVSALGEEIARAYLFESERDLKSGRYRYRLALDARRVDFLTP